MNLLSIVECAIMFASITFIDLTLQSAIGAYVIVGILLIGMTIQLKCQFKIVTSLLVQSTLQITTVVFYVEAATLQNNMLLFTMGAYSLQKVESYTVLKATLNLYFLMRLNSWQDINIPLLVLAALLWLVLVLQSRTKVERIPEIQQLNISNSTHKLLRTPSVLEPDIRKILNPMKVWDPTEQLNESFHFFNFIPDGFALLTPQNLNVQFCNSATMNLFRIQDQSQLLQCLEQLRDVMPVVNPSDQFGGSQLNRDARDSFPSFQSFYTTFHKSLNARSPRKNSKLSIIQRKQQDDVDQNQIIQDLHNVAHDRRQCTSQKNIPYSQMVGCYLASWLDTGACLNLEEPNKRLYEIVIYTTVIEDNYTIILQTRDVTHRDYIKLMKQSYKAKSNMISFVSHEYRTPLNAIIQVLTSMQDELNLDSHYQHYIKIALSSSKFLLNLSNDLLDLAQIKVGKFSIHPVEFDLRKMVDECLDMFRLQAEHKKIALVTKFKSSVPSIILNDPNRIKQIIINLLGNAFKFTLQGRIIISVSKVMNDQLKIQVSDTGIGIKEQDQQKLMTAFSKLNSEETRKLNAQGVGLGLLISNTITKNLSEDQVGLQFTSEYQVGSQFWFYITANVDGFNRIPEITDEEHSINEESPVRRQSMAAYVIRNSKQTCKCADILVVDDNSFNIDVIKIMINKMNPNLTIDCSLDGQIAVEMVRKNRCIRCHGYKMIFMDIDMPRMNGCQATQIIKSLYPNIQIIGCSGHAQKSEEIRAIKSGMNAYLVKPIDVELLKSILLQIQ